MKRSLMLLILGASFLLLASACSDAEQDDETPPADTATPTAPGDASPEETDTEEPGDGDVPFEDGTTGVTEGGGSQLDPMTTVVDVRTGEQESGYDRIVFEFEGESLPAYRIEYIVPPATQCGTGADARVEGSAALSITLIPAQAHDDEGEATIDDAELAPGHPSILEARQVCDFEGVVEWAVGVTGEQEYRVLELEEPTRLVVDIVH